MAEIDAATESPPCCPSDNGDRLDREPLRLAENAEGVAPPSHPPITRGGKGGQFPLTEGPKTKRKMSEKQLETLRKARETKAAKAKGVKSPPTQSTEDVPTTEEVSPPITKQETPKRVKKPLQNPKQNPL